MAGWDAVFSYVHEDDNAESERISCLARDLKSEFELLTGEKLDLFLDKDAIEWGEKWRDKIDDSIISAPIFIPVLTPRYFQSPECRRELQYFVHTANKMGEKDLVLPLLYVDVPALYEESQDDDLVALVRTFQWEDWTDLRLAEVGSESYRRGVNKLARRLLEANEKADNIDMVTAATALGGLTEVEAADEAPGFLDRMAITEEALPQWTATIEAITEDIVLIGNIMQEGAAEIERADSKGKGFAGKLAVARKLSHELDEPTGNIWSASNEFASQLHDVDMGMRALIEFSPHVLLVNPDDRPEICGFFGSIHELSNAVDTALVPVQGMIVEIQGTENMSRDLRPPLKRLRQGLTVLTEAREVTAEWTRLIDEAGIECGDITERDS